MYLCLTTRALCRMDRIISALTLYTVENGMLTWYDRIYVEGTPHYLTIATPCSSPASPRPSP